MEFLDIYNNIRFGKILPDSGQYYINLNSIKKYNFEWDVNLVTYSSSLIEIFQFARDSTNLAVGPIKLFMVRINN
jgi:hypothetical protein